MNRTARRSRAASRQRRVDRRSLSDPYAAAPFVLAAGSVALWCWCVGQCAALIGGHGWPGVAPSEALGLLVRVITHPATPALAWPARFRNDLPGPVAFWALFVSLPAFAPIAWRLVRFRPRGVARARHPVARTSDVDWATVNDLGPLVVRSAGAGRLVIGRHGRTLVATEGGQSLLVVGPTQSGKTSGVAIPAILEWDGPVVATSVKTDLVRASFACRHRLGRVFVFDPAAVSGLVRTRWSPLVEATTWIGAKRVAAGLCATQRDGGRSPEDAAFWGTLAEKLLAPMFLAAAASGSTMRDVVSWVDTGEARTVLDALESIGATDALESAQASFSREDRQLASVYATAEAAIAAFGDPGVAGPDDADSFDVSAFLDGGRHAAFLLAPSHDQERIRPVFVALLRCLLDEAFTRASRQGRLDPPLLVVLDEAANIAPPPNLDALASTAASHGIQLISVWQDFAQIESRYGARAATVVNNHRAKLICSGVADPATLDQVSRLIGDARDEVESVTLDKDGFTSTTVGEAERRLAPAASIRALDPGEALLVYGHLPPARLSLRDAHRDRDLRRASAGGEPTRRSAKVPARAVKAARSRS